MEKTDGAGPLDIQKIIGLLPHRYPFLLVDRVVEVEMRKRIVGIKNVTFNEPFFQGHFPGRPIMPGVLIVEAMAQTAGVLAFLSLPEEERSREVYFLGIDKVRFRRAVVPGDQLRMELEVIRQRKLVWGFAGKTLVGGDLACEAELLAMLGNR
ncbi:MAG: 3-hydroxyacyl-ACP dehydratase FabZ [Deltaproteobacteria bacterium]|nr:3-hydroxyacyl-ACP dehydratase FabZ [Deltaproteobacteria bacterium]